MARGKTWSYCVQKTETRGGAALCGAALMLLLAGFSAQPAAAQADAAEQTPVSNIVSVQQLAAPRKARKELNRAIKAIRKHHRDKCLQLLSDVIRLAPQWARPYYTRGVVFLRSHLYAQALHDLVQAAKFEPGNGLALTAIGDVYRHLHQYAQAVFYLHNAIISRSSPWQAYYELGRVNYSTGNYRLAGTNLKLALDRDPKRAFICHVVLGNVYIKLQQYGKAKQEYLAYLHFQPDAPEKPQIQHVLQKISVYQRYAGLSR